MSSLASFRRRIGSGEKQGARVGGPVDIRRALSRGEVMRICSAPRRRGTRRFYYGDLLLQLSGRYGDGRRRVHVAADARIAPGLEAKKTRG